VVQKQKTSVCYGKEKCKSCLALSYHARRIKEISVNKLTNKDYSQSAQLQDESNSNRLCENAKKS